MAENTWWAYIEHILSDEDMVSHLLACTLGIQCEAEELGILIVMKIVPSFLYKNEIEYHFPENVSVRSTVAIKADTQRQLNRISKSSL